MPRLPVIGLGVRQPREAQTRRSHSAKWRCRQLPDGNLARAGLGAADPDRSPSKEYLFGPLATGAPAEAQVECVIPYGALSDLGVGVRDQYTSCAAGN